MTKRHAGSSQRAAKERNARFVQAYIASGENATEAYLAVKPTIARNSAATEGWKLLKLPEIQKAIEVERAKLRAKFSLTTDRVVQELARIAYFNPRRMVDAKGKPVELHKLDEDTAAGLTLELDGKHNVLKVRTVAPSAKNTAVEKAVKILRLYDKPPPPPPAPPGAAPLSADPKDTARRMAFLLARGAAAEHREANPQPAPVKRKAKIAA